MINIIFIHFEIHRMLNALHSKSSSKLEHVVSSLISSTKYRKEVMKPHTWRLGSSMESRPVAVDVWSQWPCSVYFCVLADSLANEQMDPKVQLKSFANVRCSLMTGTIGCSFLKYKIFIKFFVTVIHVSYPVNK